MKLYSFGAVSPVASSLNPPLGICQVIFIPAGPVNRIEVRWLMTGGAMPGVIAPTAATAPGGPIPGTGRTPAFGGAARPSPGPNPLAWTTLVLFAYPPGR